MVEVVQPSESLMWHIEADPLLRSTIVAVVLLDQVPAWDVLRSRVDYATRKSPGFRQRMVEPPLRAGRPQLIDADVDLAFHLRHIALPPGAALDDVFEFARNEGMEAFDPARPLWRFTVLEGLPGGCAAAVLKAHHALTDGVGSMQLAEYLFDVERDAAQPDVPGEAPTAGRVDPRRVLLDAVGQNVLEAIGAARSVGKAAVPTIVGALRHPRSVAAQVTATAASIGRMVKPITATRSSVMTKRTLVWRYEPIDVPFAELRAGARAAGGTLNDAFLGAVTGGFRLYHEKAGAPVEQLRITLPISVREGHDRIGGNRFTLLRFDVPVGEADPVVRMQRLHDLVAAQRAEPSIPHTQRVAAVLDLLPHAVMGGMLKHIDAVVSNVPGLAVPVYLAGAKVTAFYPFGPTSGAAVNLTLLSYDGTCHIGVNIDVGAVPDPDLLVACLRDGIAEIVAIGRDAAGTVTAVTEEVG